MTFHFICYFVCLFYFPVCFLKREEKEARSCGAWEETREGKQIRINYIKITILNTKKKNSELLTSGVKFSCPPGHPSTQA